MTESGSFERRGERIRDLEIITRRQANWMADTLSHSPVEAQLFKEGLSIRVVQDPELNCVFPAHLTSNAIGSKYTLFFDNPTVQELSLQFSRPYQLTETEIAELYIGTAIASHLLIGSIREPNIQQVRKMVNILANPDPAIDEVRVTSMFDEKQRSDIIQGIMQSSETRIGNINLLRFAFGMVYLQSEEMVSVEDLPPEAEQREVRVMRQFREGLLETLRNRPQYQMLGRFAVPEDKLAGQFRGEKVFADAVREFELAACFPMGWQELRRVISVAKQQ